MIYRPFCFDRRRLAIGFAVLVDPFERRCDRGPMIKIGRRRRNRAAPRAVG